jgi:hypothetical protein
LASRRWHLPNDERLFAVFDEGKGAAANGAPFLEWLEAGEGSGAPRRSVGFFDLPAVVRRLPIIAAMLPPWRMVKPIVFAILGGYALGRPISIEIEHGLLLNHRVLHAPSMPDNGGGAFNTLSNKEPPLGRNSP